MDIGKGSSRPSHPEHWCWSGTGLPTWCNPRKRRCRFHGPKPQRDKTDFSDISSYRILLEHIIYMYMSVYTYIIYLCIHLFIDVYISDVCLCIHIICILTSTYIYNYMYVCIYHVYLQLRMFYLSIFPNGMPDRLSEYMSEIVGYSATGKGSLEENN